MSGRLRVYFKSPDEEEDYGEGVMPHTPRVGEYIWLQNNNSREGMLSGKVAEVAYWVPNSWRYRIAPIAARQPGSCWTTAQFWDQCLWRVAHLMAISPI